jgi:glutamate 5-kinase
MTAKRIIIKVGSSTLTGDAGTSLNGSAVTKLVDVVADLKGKGKEVIIVTSAAISAGMAPLGLTERPTDLATQHASASVVQGLLIA